MLKSLEPSPLTPIHSYPQVAGRLHLLTMSGHQGPVTSISTTLSSRNNLIILSGSTDGTLRSWDCEGSGVIKTYDGHTSDILCICVSGNGEYVVSGGKDKSVR